LENARNHAPANSTVIERTLRTKVQITARTIGRLSRSRASPILVATMTTALPEQGVLLDLGVVEVVTGPKSLSAPPQPVRNDDQKTA